VLEIPHGREIVVDATAGRIDPAPAAEALEAARHAMAERAAERTRSLDAAHAPAQTIDGQAIEVAANIAAEADAGEAERFGADGVGLVRTEILFLDRQSAPSEDEQRAAYQSIVDALAGKPAIIRTWDAGADKPLAFMSLPSELNPSLGLRGIRSALVRPELLETQLKALLRVRPLSACRIMLPMISDVAELVAVREQINRLAISMSLTERPQLGVMVEVPSAAVLADQLAREADFLSLGTNDLTQYTLAMDRGHPGLAGRLDGLHPAVLRLIAMTVDGATRQGKWVGVCGALASDLEAVPVLIGLGVRELSVSPGMVPQVKARVRTLDLDGCRREARLILELASAAEVRERVRGLYPLAQ
jgi:phosphoenolpyruvate-protein kinase (PTS system EI component)